MTDRVAVAALILAAGRGTRFGAGPHDSKAAACLDGVPMVRRVALAALASQARPVVVVTGHAAASVTGALAGLAVTAIHNRDYADGLAGSLKAGLAALPAEIAGALVLLADMPHVDPRTLDALITAFNAAPAEIEAVIPTHHGRPGNPLLLARRLFPRLAELDGDRGARAVLDAEGRATVFVEVVDAGIVVDVDTRADLMRSASS